VEIINVVKKNLFIKVFYMVKLKIVIIQKYNKNLKENSLRLYMVLDIYKPKCKPSRFDL